MKKEDLLGFRDRWATVHAFEREELMRLSPEKRLRHLWTLMSSVEGMGWGDALRREGEEARASWIRLKTREGK